MLGDEEDDSLHACLNIVEPTDRHASLCVRHGEQQRGNPQNIGTRWAHTDRKQYGRGCLFWK